MLDTTYCSQYSFLTGETNQSLEKVINLFEVTQIAGNGANIK